MQARTSMISRGRCSTWSGTAMASCAALITTRKAAGCSAEGEGARVPSSEGVIFVEDGDPAVMILGGDHREVGAGCDHHRDDHKRLGEVERVAAGDLDVGEHGTVAPVCGGTIPARQAPEESGSMAAI